MIEVDDFSLSGVSVLTSFVVLDDTTNIQVMKL